LLTTTATIWGITVALGVAAAAIVAEDGRVQDENRLLQQACAGQPSNVQAEDTLATLRALSNGGSDPICTKSTSGTN
jgi:hypothetical protein